MFVKLFINVTRQIPNDELKVVEPKQKIFVLLFCLCERKSSRCLEDKRFSQTESLSFEGK